MKKPPIILLSAILLIVIILSIWRPWQLQKPRRLHLSAEDISPVVILPFDTRQAGEDWQWLSTALVDLLATGLNVYPPVQAVRLERFLEQIGPLSLRGGITVRPAEAIKLFGARSVLTGKVLAQNGSFIVDIWLLGDEGKSVLFRGQEGVENPADIFSATDRLIGDLLGALDWEKLPTLRPTSAATTTSLPAYRHYLMAIEDYILSDEISLPRAADHLTLAVAADSDFARAYFLRAKVSDQAQALDIPLEFPEDALVLALQFPGRLPEWERLYALGWRLWMVDGDLDGAVSTLKKLVEIYREYAWNQGVPLTLSRLLIHQGRWSEAIEELEAYIRSDEVPKLRRILGWGQLALAHQMTGHLEQAIESLENELSLYSDHLGNRYWWIDENMTLALLYFEAGESARQEEVMQRAEEVAWDDPRALAMMGLARFHMQQINRAEILAEKALRLSSDVAIAHYLRGLLSLRQKHYWQAVADLEAACTQAFDWDFLYHAALAHANRGDHSNASELWKLLVDVLGGDEPEKVLPENLGSLGILLSRLGKAEEALALGTQAVDRFPYPQSKYDLACIHSILGNKGAALRWLRAACADGFVNRRQARTDFDLEALWYDPDFILLTLPE
jgi:tetratricopeptide (TPR) repeat protein